MSQCRHQCPRHQTETHEAAFGQQLKVVVVGIVDGCRLRNARHKKEILLRSILREHVSIGSKTRSQQRIVPNNSRAVLPQLEPFGRIAWCIGKPSENARGQGDTHDRRQKSQHAQALADFRLTGVVASRARPFEDLGRQRTRSTRLETVTGSMQLPSARLRSTEGPSSREDVE